MMPVTLKQVHDKLVSIETAMKERATVFVRYPLWLKIVIGVALLLVIIEVIGVFKKHSPVDNSYLQKMEQLEEKVQLQTEKIDALQQGQSLRDSIIFNQLEAIKNNRPTQTRIIERYEKIPNSVNSLDKSGLRKQVTEY